MYLALGSVHPVTLAVGNTMKRVIIMVASVMVFGNEISVQAGIGSGVGISGVLLYSLTKQYHESLEAKQAAENAKKGPFGRRVMKKAEKVKATAKVTLSNIKSVAPASVAVPR
jgi:solute carrier family 35 protein E1